MRRLVNCLNPINVIKRIFHILFHSTLVLSIPFFGIAWILFYHIGNPQLDFLPGEATISWWLNFFGMFSLAVGMSLVLSIWFLTNALVFSSKAANCYCSNWLA
jgi:hypothetical protein